MASQTQKLEQYIVITKIQKLCVEIECRELKKILDKNCINYGGVKSQYENFTMIYSKLRRYGKL